VVGAGSARRRVELKIRREGIVRSGRLVLGLLLTLAALPASPQLGHPAKGAWLGYWGPSEAERRRILLSLDWQDRQVVGTINPGPNAIEIERVAIDYATWTMTIEADMPLASGKTARYVATGKLENLGSWLNRRYSGTYRHGDETGTFILSLN
jgi:hypothetical protein